MSTSKAETQANGGATRASHALQLTSLSEGWAEPFSVFALAAGGPDLQLLTASAPSSARVGDLINVNWTVKNIGSAPATTPWNEGIYFSTDATLDFSDIFAISYSPTDVAPLAAGESHSRTQSFSVPGTDNAGLNYLIVNIDPWSGESSDTNADNNSFAIPITVDINGPDLELVNASAPSSARVGDVIQVSWSVKNSGAAATAGSWWPDDIYISTDGTFDYEDTFIGSFSDSAVIAPLAAGESYNRSRSISVPSTGRAGQNYLIFRTNFERGNQGETTKQNNISAVPIMLDLNGTDLMLFAASAPSRGTVGDIIQASWTVKNVGAAPAAAKWNDDIYLSKDDTYDSNDIFVGSYANSGINDQPLAASASYTQTQSFSLENTGQAGLNYLIFRTNIWGEQAETSRDNNSFSIPITIDLNGPDLQLISASAPSSAKVGDLINLRWTVKNAGSTRATGDWYDFVTLSSNPTLDYNEDTYVTNQSASDAKPLAAGKSYRKSTTISLPSTGKTGLHYLIFETNPGQSGGVQGESRKDNNAFVLPITLNPGGPDLELLTASAPISASLGSRINVSWTVKNVGDSPAAASWGEDISLSSDNTYDNEDMPLAVFPAADVKPLAAGRSYSRTGFIDLPNTGSTGLNYLIIQTNPERDQGETNWANNTFTIPITLTPNSLPTITLTPPSSSVAEDGVRNLEYTFTRTGATTSPLTVSYTIGGSASLGSDYTGISKAGTPKKLVFPIGANSTTLTVDPVADGSSEPNETITLQLSSGANYIIGTHSAVTGTILNDDLIGTKSSDTLVGSALDENVSGLAGNDTLQGGGGQDRLDGGIGADLLTGGTGNDIFFFRPKQSLLAAPDRLTDFAIGADRLGLLSASGAALPPPTAFSRASDSQATNLASMVSAVFTDANGATDGSQPLATRSAALVVATAPAIAGTWLVINDAKAGFQSSNDLLINLTGLTGPLPAPGTIPGSPWFV
jgi:subtilase family serine protease